MTPTNIVNQNVAMVTDIFCSLYDLCTCGAVSFYFLSVVYQHGLGRGRGTLSYNCIIVHVMSSILVYSDSKTHIEYQLHGTECVDGVDIKDDPSR